LIVDERLDLREQLLRVFDRVALGQLVLLGQDLAGLVHEHGFRRSRSTVEADDGAHARAGLKGGGHERRDRIFATERRELFGLRGKTGSRRGGKLRGPSAGNKFLERIEAAICSGVRRLVQPVEDRAVGRVVLGVGRHRNELLDRDILRIVETARLPRLGNPLSPARLQERQERVRSAQQQHLGFQRVAARQHRQVLQHDRVGQRAHDLARRNPGLDQVDDVGFGEDAALGGDVMQPRRIPFQILDLVAGHADFDQALVDRRAGARRALVVHRRGRALSSGCVLREHDDLGVLAAEFDDAAGLGMQRLHRHRDGVDFLHELRA
jgi:hypothetical protein